MTVSEFRAFVGLLEFDVSYYKGSVSVATLTVRDRWSMDTLNLFTWDNPEHGVVALNTFLSWLGKKHAVTKKVLYTRVR